jgi:hypothetical protein
VSVSGRFWVRSDQKLQGRIRRCLGLPQRKSLQRTLDTLCSWHHTGCTCCDHARGPAASQSSAPHTCTRPCRHYRLQHICCAGHREHHDAPSLSCSLDHVAHVHTVLKPQDSHTADSAG